VHEHEEKLRAIRISGIW